MNAGDAAQWVNNAIPSAGMDREGRSGQRPQDLFGRRLAYRLVSLRCSTASVLRTGPSRKLVGALCWSTNEGRDGIFSRDSQFKIKLDAAFVPLLQRCKKEAPAGTARSNAGGASKKEILSPAGLQFDRRIIRVAQPGHGCEKAILPLAHRPDVVELLARQAEFANQGHELVLANVIGDRHPVR